MIVIPQQFDIEDAIARLKEEKASQVSPTSKKTHRFKAQLKKIDAQIEALELMRQLPPGTSVEHEGQGQGIVKCHGIDDRGIPMTSVDFEGNGINLVSPRELLHGKSIAPTSKPNSSEAPANTKAHHGQSGANGHGDSRGNESICQQANLDQVPLTADDDRGADSLIAGQMVSGEGESEERDLGELEREILSKLNTSSLDTTKLATALGLSISELMPKLNLLQGKGLIERRNYQWHLPVMETNGFKVGDSVGAAAKADRVTHDGNNREWRPPNWATAPKPLPSPSAPTVDFWCGGGGVGTAGFLQAGFQIGVNIDRDPKNPGLSEAIADYYELNFSKPVVRETLQGYAARDGFREQRRPDAVVFTQSCKNLSRANQNASEDETDIAVAQATAQGLEELLPSVFVLENVREYKASQCLHIIEEALSRLGYKWVKKVLNAWQYGVAQDRERFILIAAKGVVPALPEPTVNEALGWGDAIADLIETFPLTQPAPWQLKGLSKGLDGDLLISGSGHSPNKEGNEPAFTVSASQANNRMRVFLVERAGARDNTPKIRESDRPSWTVKGSIFTDQKGANRHDGLNTWDGNGEWRRVANRGIARLMGLYDWYQLPDKPSVFGPLLGNGLPSEMARVIASSCLELLDEASKDSSQASTATQDAGTTPDPIPLTFFKPGDCVNHPNLDQGVIVSIDEPEGLWFDAEYMAATIPISANFPLVLWEDGTHRPVAADSLKFLGNGTVPLIENRIGHLKAELEAIAHRTGSHWQKKRIQIGRQIQSLKSNPPLNMPVLVKRPGQQDLEATAQIDFGGEFLLETPEDAFICPKLYIYPREPISVLAIASSASSPLATFRSRAANDNSLKTFEVLRIDGTDAIVVVPDRDCPQRLPLDWLELNEEAIALLTDEQLTLAIKVNHKACETHFQEAISSLNASLWRAKQAGQMLQRKKKAVGHGGWLKWLKGEDIGERSAQVYSRVAENWGKITESAAACGIALEQLTIEGALRLIAKSKESKVAQAEEPEVVDGELVSEEEATDPEPPPPKAIPAEEVFKELALGLKSLPPKGLGSLLETVKPALSPQQSNELVKVATHIAHQSLEQWTDKELIELANSYKELMKQAKRLLNERRNPQYFRKEDAS